MDTPFDFKSEQQRIRSAWLKLLGPFPSRKVAMEPKILSEEKLEHYTRIKVSFMAQEDDPVYAWLLVPHHLQGKTPAMLCLHPTTYGSGKDRVIGGGLYPKGACPTGNDPGEEGRSYGKHLAERGFVVLAPDLYAEGERVKPGFKPYDVREFYQKNPEWSVVGKAIWDNRIAVDYLHALDFVDTGKIGVIGHSLGGHSSIFLAGFDERVSLVVSNGGCTMFKKALEHWARIPPPVETGEPPMGSGYTYIPKFRPYMANSGIPNPVEFWDIMALVCPRPMMFAGATSNSGHPGGLEVMQDTWDNIHTFYDKAGFEANIQYHIYPGEHNFPPRAREYIYRWIEGIFNSGNS